jgi:hypothetical protein
MAVDVEAQVAAVLDIIYPIPDGSDERRAIFQWGWETEPTAEDMRDLATEIVTAVNAVPEHP